MYGEYGCFVHPSESVKGKVSIPVIVDIAKFLSGIKNPDKDADEISTGEKRS